MLKFLFWVALLGATVWNGFLGFNAWYNNWKVEDVFVVLVDTRPSASEAEVRSQMQKLFGLKYILNNDLPDEFFDNLSIKASGSMLEISSYYAVTIWPAGRVVNRDEDGSYHPDDLTGMDLLRDKLRIDLEFEPYAITDPSRIQAENL
ncbi:hypothetical protein MMIC_P1555 [Mariprofundus micogutta]|uniref:Uncharacterized protein n=1 Tax=Mariprofundus micogutta TaxID=1921010 RepID=A0A1L8CNT9_9PROT|nr:hypothetical protein MMIC_P1555 [Mariprofundus micogutta]